MNIKESIEHLRIARRELRRAHQKMISAMQDFDEKSKISRQITDGISMVNAGFACAEQASKILSEI